jgi:hypothetical protein
LLLTTPPPSKYISYRSPLPPPPLPKPVSHSISPPLSVTSPATTPPLTSRHVSSTSPPCHLRLLLPPFDPSHLSTPVPLLSMSPMSCRHVPLDQSHNSKASPLPPRPLLALRHPTPLHLISHTYLAAYRSCLLPHPRQLHPCLTSESLYKGLMK